MDKLLLVIVGPTAIGKSRLAIDIAEKLGTEIISCDSRQIYRELNIGTAKPTAEELNRIKHHFIGTVSIHDYYNASKFEVAALQAIDNIFKTQKVAIMVGGSGLYLDAVCNGIDDLPTIDAEIRSNLLKRYELEGIGPLRQELFKIDPIYSKSADIRNPKRVLKALEVFYMTGKPYSGFLTKEKKERNFSIYKIGLNCERSMLYNTINQRVDNMVKNGLIEEARQLYPFNKLNALNTVGYKELFQYFSNEITLENAIEQIKQNTRRYAKRQITWFSRDKEITWFNPEKNDEIWEYVKTLI